MHQVRAQVPIPPQGYSRTFEARIDDHSRSEIFVRGVLQDDRYGIEHTWVLHTPEYEVVEAAARHLAGKFLSPELPSRYAAIQGVRIGRGFSRTIREALGDLSGTREYLFLAIEMARVGQQVYKFPEGFDAGLPPVVEALAPGPSQKARLAWEKDRAYMPDLRNSCYTYRDESAQLFLDRQVTCTFGASVTSPPPGTKGIFWRKKDLRIAKTGEGSFQCRNTMQDSIHDISVNLRLGRDGIIQQAVSEGRRLPYDGLCQDAQLRTVTLEGKQIDGDFIRLLGDHVGGAAGCTHLFDLSVDCLRLFEFE